MDAGLRKRHKYIWLFLAIVIPILLILVIKDLDFSQTADTNHTIESLSNPIDQAKHNLMDAVVIEKDGARVLEMNVKQPLKSASSIILSLNDNQEIGQIEGVGTYSFPLKSEIRGIIIKDVIKNQEILKLEF
ncbi:hypothetical protein [Flagellimonas sp. W118]|uniref:hypothetical protein n=1 Tax=Flagellimonas sp. W118 TaxID=3410791 RepID=UPI003BF5A279